MRDNSGRYARENGTTELLKQIPIGKVIIITLTVLLLLPHAGKLKNLFSNIVTASACQSEDSTETIIYTILDQAYGTKDSSIGFEWVDKYAKMKKKEHSKDSHRTSILKMQMYENAKKKAYDLLEKDLAKKLKDDLIKEDPTLMTDEKITPKATDKTRKTDEKKANSS